MLKLIPQENPDEIRKITAKKARRFMASGPGVFELKKMHVNNRKDSRILKHVCVKLVRFIQRTGRHTHQEMGEMIESLRRSVLSLERQRQRIIITEQKKKRRTR